VERGSPAILDDIHTFLERQRPWGALLLPPISERADIAQLCDRMGVRYVRVGSAVLDAPDRCVASNDQQAVAQACAALIARGHRRIGFVRGPRGFRSAQEREAGFLAALDAAGLALPKRLRADGDYRFESGIEAGLRLLQQDEPPTAIFASNDEMAAGVLATAHQLGIDVPRQLSIVGFDDSPTAAHTWPPLSTVRWPIFEMGSLAALKLLPQLRAAADRPSQPARLPVTMESKFIERKSVGAPGERTSRRRN
jgi:LacI family transcriptional regulator